MHTDYDNHFCSIAGCSKDLGYDIRPDGTKYSPLLKARHLPTDRLFVRVEDLYVSWTSDRDKMVLSNVSFEIEKTRGNKVCQHIACLYLDALCFKSEGGNRTPSTKPTFQESNCSQGAHRGQRTANERAAFTQVKSRSTHREQSVWNELKLSV